MTNFDRFLNNNREIPIVFGGNMKEQTKDQQVLDILKEQGHTSSKHYRKRTPPVRVVSLLYALSLNSNLGNFQRYFAASSRAVTVKINTNTVAKTV